MKQDNVKMIAHIVEKIHMDEDGYPEQGELEHIIAFDVSENNVWELLDYIKDIWWTPDFGWKEKDFFDEDFPDYKMTRLYLSTGGWSGNEDIMEALWKNQWFFHFFWRWTRRGGHYMFEVPRRYKEVKE